MWHKVKKKKKKNRFTSKKLIQIYNEFANRVSINLGMIL